MKSIYLRNINKLYSKNGNIHKFLQVKKNTKNISEIYFSEVKFLKIKCWKKHLLNNLRLHVIKGQIRFVVISGNKKMYRFDLNELSDQYMYIPKKTIFGFQGLKKKNVLLCSLEKSHNDKEVQNFSYEEFSNRYWK